MEKIVLLKSVYVGIQEDGTLGEAQIQRIERWTGLPEGAVIPDTYLPLERFAVSTATDEERPALEAVLGEVAHGHAEQAQHWKVQHAEERAKTHQAELALTDLTARHEELSRQHEGLNAVHAQARIELEVAQQQHTQLAEQGFAAQDEAATPRGQLETVAVERDHLTERESQRAALADVQEALRETPDSRLGADVHAP